MNAKFQFARLLIVTALLLSTLAVYPTTVFADKPISYSFDFAGDAVITDLCPFPINFHSEMHAVWTDFFVDGQLTKSLIFVTEQDTFSTEAVTLVGLPYQYNVKHFFDRDGNMTLNFSVGVAEKVPLPDGTLFIAAGQINYFNHPDGALVFTPDMGTSGKVDAFCAAIAP